MEKVIQFSEREEAKALPILLRHSPGVILPNRIYVLSAEAIDALRTAGVSFHEIGSTDVLPTKQGVGTGERV